MPLKIIRLILLCASMYGYIGFFGEKIAPELSIGFTFAGIGSVMFAAGLLNLLPEAALIVFVLGLACLARKLAKREWKPRFTPGGAFFLAVCAVLAVRLYGEKLVYIDNFTHWETAVLHLLTKDRFPNFMDPYIRFQSYPLGTASLIYYFAKVSGIRAEWFQMLAHWACAAAMLSGLFCLAKDVPARIACCVAALLLLCADNEFTQLLVDSTLGYVALCAAAFSVYYGRALRQKGYYVIPWLTYLVAVKNNGALLALYVVALVLLWGGWRKGLAALAATLGTLFLWNRHVSYVFEQGMMAQHAMSIEHFRQMLAVKKPGAVENILHKMTAQVFSLNNAYLPVLLLSAALLVVALVRAKEDRAVRGLLIYGAVCYLIYQAGMLGMYVFTMQEKEALRLASYDRYHGTIWIFASGIMLIAAMRLAGDLRAHRGGRAWAGACCAACAVAIAVSGMPHVSYYTRYMDEDARSTLAIRERVDDMVAQYGIVAGKRYYVLVDEDFTSAETAYLYNMVNCLMLADDVQVRKLGQIYSNEEIDACDYMIGFGEDEEIGAYIYDTYGTRDRVVDLSKTPRKPEAATSDDKAGAKDDDKAEAGPINLREALMGNGK